MKRSAQPTTNHPAKKKKKKKTKKRRNNKPPPSLAAPVMSSRRRARQVTTSFHRLTHEIERVRTDKALDDATRTTMLQDLEQQLQDSGGRDAYQQASVVNTSMFSTSKYVTATLTKLGVRKSSGEPLPNCLEVGAINCQLVTNQWLNVDAIDINSRHPKIQQINFFAYPVVENKYNVVVCSMVINCISTPPARGRLLVDCRRHLTLGGYFFIMLPLLCLNSTPFVNGKEQFCKGIRSIGFRLVEEKITNKVGMFVFQKIDQVKMGLGKSIFADPPRVVVRSSRKKKFHSDFAVSIVGDDGASGESSSSSSTSSKK
jgi:25S rRNA (adenine2142-N1)-methyltransferase